jgi:hypothetical protein
MKTISINKVIREIKKYKFEIGTYDSNEDLDNKLRKNKLIDDIIQIIKDSIKEKRNYKIANCLNCANYREVKPIKPGDTKIIAIRKRKT